MRWGVVNALRKQYIWWTHLLHRMWYPLKHGNGVLEMEPPNKQILIVCCMFMMHQEDITQVY